MHINYWNRKYGKKKTAFLVLPQSSFFHFFLSQEGVLRVFVVEKCLLGVCAWACVCMGNRTRCEHYANASHKHSFNSPYMHLSCLWVHLFRSYIQYISHACVCVYLYAVQLSVMWITVQVECCVDSLGVTEAVAACYKRWVFTTSKQNKKNPQ